MVLYEYPTKTEKAVMRRQAAVSAAKRKKLRVRSILTYIISAAVFLLGLTAEGVFAKAAICFLAVFAAGLNVVTSQLAFMGMPDENTIVTDNGFTHETKPFAKKKQRFEISFDDIEKTEQDGLGDLVIKMKSGEMLTIHFQVTKTKLFLLNELHEKLKYDKKQYNIISDDDAEEKDWVDRL